jgi:hypothetical protein
MATYNKGILGAFTGTVGSVVGANWRGMNVMRSRPRKTTRTPTEVQMQQREKFGFVTGFLTPIRYLYNKYFGQNVGVKSRYNMAVSYHIREAIELTGQTYGMIFNKVLIAKGELQGVQDGTATPEAGQQIKLEWLDNSGQGLALPDDSLLAVIYSPELNLFQVFEYAALRADAEATLTVMPYFAGLPVHCWVTFVNDGRKVAASSTYMGEITLL